MMKFGVINIPPWFEEKLIQDYGPDVQLDPEYGRKAILGVLLEDYLKRNDRNQPKPKKANKRKKT